MLDDISAEELAQRAFDLNLIEERDLREVRGSLGARSHDVEELKQVLLRSELLTNFQLDRLLKGDRHGYFYGKYKLLYQIGTGTFARVYRAVHSETQEIVAVKVLRRRFNEDAEQRENFKKEGEVGLTLRHPNVVPIYDVVASRSGSYMAMEFVEGQNLREFIKVRKRLEPEEATRIAIDIAAGLDYAFNRGISHRDLKLSNVLYSSLGVAKLLDFGLAGADGNMSDEALANLDNPRTIDYAALERSSNVRKDDNRSDIYFVGCMYYHLLAGVPPLAETRDRTQRLSKNRFLEVVPLQRHLPDIPLGILAVVNKAMQFEPDKRYQTPGEMLFELRRSQEAPAEDPSKNGRPVQKQETLMIVESGTTLQNVLREQLKKSGYKVLVTSDPQRPLSWFTEKQKPADCVLFSTANFGQTALEAFNEFGEQESTVNVPAILLLGPKHIGWKSLAKVSPTRMILGTPLKLRELRIALSKVLNPEAVKAAQDS